MTASVEVKGEHYIPLRVGPMAVLYIVELGDYEEHAVGAMMFYEQAARMALELHIQQPETLQRFIAIARSTNTTKTWARAAHNAATQVRIAYE